MKSLFYNVVSTIFAEITQHCIELVLVIVLSLNLPEITYSYLYIHLLMELICKTFPKSIISGNRVKLHDLLFQRHYPAANVFAMYCLLTFAIHEPLFTIVCGSLGSTILAKANISGDY